MDRRCGNRSAGPRYDRRTRIDRAGNPGALRSTASIHLAAQSFVPESFRDPRRTYEVNFFGTLNLFQTLKNGEFQGRLLYVSSAEVYGQVDPAEMPIDEHRPADRAAPTA